MFVFLGEFLLEFPEFDLVLPEKCPLVHVLVDPRLILDFLSARRKLQSGDRLSETLRGGRDHCHHCRLAIAAQGVLQQTSQLRVTVRDMRTRTLVRQSRYNVTQTR